MEIAVLGGGMVGSLIATELSKDYHITVIDNEPRNLEGVKSKIMDVNSEEFSLEILNYNIAINCLPGFMGFKILKTLIDKEISCIDISFMPENCLDLSRMAQTKNCIVVPDAGVAPGLSNLIIGNIVANNDIKEIKIMVGGLPKKKNPPWNYKAPFSPIDVIEEYTRPARIKVNGEILVKEALTDIQNFEVENIGKLEAFLTDGLRTLLNSDQKISSIPNLSEYTIRYPGHADLIKKLIKDGNFSNDIIQYKNKKITKKERTCMKLFKEWKLDNEDEFTFMIILATTKTGEDIAYTVYDERTNGWSSMSRTTGLTACAFTKLLVNKKISGNGIQCPEKLGQIESNYHFVLDYLKEKGISIQSN
jgi:saccharopine dehydrogenase-like NADP-dependent oxidoreductase|tara:strand:+ start:1655 stop:2743 length:1089 start_codon:yes stop_codon:yes gene_type:complete